MDFLEKMNIKYSKDLASLDFRMVQALVFDVSANGGNAGISFAQATIVTWAENSGLVCSYFVVQTGVFLCPIVW